MANEVVKRDIDKSLISDVAMEIGKQMVAYLEVQYPDVYAAMNSGCKLSIRNHIHNDIMWAINNRSEQEYRDWIDARKKRRRDWLKTYRALRLPHTQGTKAMTDKLTEARIAELKAAVEKAQDTQAYAIIGAIDDGKLEAVFLDLASHIPTILALLAERDRLREALRQTKRASEMSANITRETERTKATGKVAEMCERIASQFDRLASSARTALGE